ncbi:hypothetical protein [Amycolatopsis sp.]|uniref:hypothetical protein n=1 Tax=Amycolatopsis sp. TaxID=37632 RepID=UPI002D803E65|nr:hypothetical protein [Amycolatopsis sp.]HET6705893.1 hypothetical protein [Amycolatopsis sp.]
MLIEPREWRWLGELSSLNGGSPLRRGWALSDAQALAGTMLNEAVVVPAVALLPVSVAVLVRLAAGWRARLAWLLLPAAAVLVVLAAVVLQGQWFQYHLAALVPFFFGNPAHCRYPAPVFVQRGTYIPAVRGLASYRENLGCLEHADAGYLVVQPSWLALDRLAAEVAAGVHRRFDCERAMPAGQLTGCPRR